MKKTIEQLAGRAMRLSFVVILLLMAESCYTPWQKAQAEKEARAQFATVEKSIYVPSNAMLLTEVHFSEQSNHFAVAGVEQIYVMPSSCAEIIAEYSKKMTDSGWTVNYVGGCDKRLWIDMRASQNEQAYFGIYATPGEKSRLAKKWQLLQGQYQGLYYVLSSLTVWYDKSSQ